MAKRTTKAATSKATPEKAGAAASGARKASAKAGAKVMPAPEISKTLGKRELIDRVVEASGIKKKAAKPVIEAMLRELGDALSRGETLNLQPLGKGIVKNRKSLENADVVELRLRRSRQAMSAATAPEGLEGEESAPATDPLAEAAE